MIRPTAYLYQCEVYCPRCLPLTREYVDTEHRPLYAIVKAVERVLDNLAAPTGKLGHLQVDRTVELEFDSWDFPKVLFGRGVCGECGEDYG